MQVYHPRLTAKLLFGMALAGSLCFCLPVRAQEPSVLRQAFPLNSPASTILRPTEPVRPGDAFHFRALSMLEFSPGYVTPLEFRSALRFKQVSWSSSPSTIEKMESAFYCNDTPFVDQVRFPLATLWSGRVKLIGFESDVTTANFVLGLPGQGSLHTLSAFGNAFIATHTPSSDQLAGIHMTISLHPTDTDAAENSGRRGIEYLVRASRGFLPFLSARPDSITFAAR